MSAQSSEQSKYDLVLAETPAYTGTSEVENISSDRTRRNQQISSSRTSSSLRQHNDSTVSSSSLSRFKALHTPATGISSVRSKTPGSRRTPRVSSTSTPTDLTAVVVAVVEGRGLAKGEIGMASIDLKRPVLSLSQFSDSQTYVKVMTKLQIMQPLEIILPNTACENGNMTKLYKLIADQCLTANIAAVPRKYFNETRGLQYIKQLCLPELSTVEMELRNKYYCLATTAALLKYIEFIQNIFYAPSSLTVVFKGSEQTTMIDVSTAKILELQQNLRDPKSGHTLYGILNYTRTPMGSRLLRANILQPPCHLETIRMRLDAVAELTENEEMFYNIQGIVGRFLDIDHLLSTCVQIPKQNTMKTADSKITSVICLKHTLQLVEPLKVALKDSQNALLKAYYRSMEDPRFSTLVEKIDLVIHEDTRYQKGVLNMRTQKCFAVKPDINEIANKNSKFINRLLNYLFNDTKPLYIGLLDVARRTYTELVDDIAETIKQLGETHGLPLKNSYNSTRGFHIQLLCTGKEMIPAESLPGEFIKVTKFKSTYTFTTTTLIKMNDRVKEAVQEIYQMTDIVVSGLLDEIRKYFGVLYKLAECVSMCDLLVAFAHNCTLSNYTRPIFTDTLAIKQGIHPILDKISRDPPVPNNTYACDESNFIIITGPNMSGKSTYLRQVALLQIMAQMGSFVSAEYASFRIADQIFSRIGSDDDIETNSSTFMLEMKQINYIVQNATTNSLILIDELGRGTSVLEGVGICHAVCEYLLSLKAFTFFATHFLELTELDSLYPNVENYHFQVQKVSGNERQLQKAMYTHVLSQGRTKEEHYGIQLAKASSLPREITDEATRLLEAITKQKQIFQPKSAQAGLYRANFKLGKKLLQVATNCKIHKNILPDYLKSLREQYLKEIKQ